MSDDEQVLRLALPSRHSDEKVGTAYVNFFQYPPPNFVATVSDDILRKELGLDDPVSNEAFTIFISVPYCRVRCHSCPYFRNIMPNGPGFDDHLDEYVTALVDQIQKFGSTVRFSGRSCGSVYLGGGTASLLSPRQIEHLTAALRAGFSLSDGTEITLEGNPHEFTGSYLRAVHNNGVSRISIGLQSFHPEILKGSLNSPHTAEEGRVAAEQAVAAGFNTVNIDLLYQVPGQTLDQWQDDVHRAAALEPEGITTYRYVVHSGSASEHLIEQAKLSPQSDLATAHQWYTWARSFLREHGYVEHRKGSFSKPGHLQLYGHLTYGKGSELIGIGAGAYGYTNGHQWISTSSAQSYLTQARSGRFPIIERISVKANREQLMERFIIFGFFETTVDRKAFKRLFEVDILNVFGEIFNGLASDDLIQIDDDRVTLTDKGLMYREKVQRAFYHAISPTANTCSTLTTVTQ